MNVEKFHERIEELYLPPEKEFTIVDVPVISYMVVDGKGNPESEAFRSAVKWLFSLAYLIKPVIKARMGKDFKEPPLECLFWAECEKDFIEGNKDNWQWRVMIVTIPDWVPPDLFQDAVKKAEAKLGPAPSTLRVEQMHEGQSVQIMHIGNYEGVRAVCDKLYGKFLPDNGLIPRGNYHEIYLNDPSRVATEKRKIVIRQPVRQCRQS